MARASEQVRKIIDEHNAECQLQRKREIDLARHYVRPRLEEMSSDRVNGVIRRTPEERAHFAEVCSPGVRAAANALHDRFDQLGVRPPFADDDTAWTDLADIAIYVASEVDAEEQLKLDVAMIQASLNAMMPGLKANGRRMLGTKVFGVEDAVTGSRNGIIGPKDIAAAVDFLATWARQEREGNHGKG